METINTNVVKQQPKLTGQIGNTLIYVDPDLEDKKVEIVENGVYTIKADEKFDGLNEVEITSKVEPKPKIGFTINKWSEDGYPLTLETHGYTEIPQYGFGVYDTSYSNMVLFMSRLNELILNEGITKLCKRAFRGMSGVKKLRIPNSVTSVEEGFANGLSISSLSFENLIIENSTSLNAPLGYMPSTIKAIWFGWTYNPKGSYVFLCRDTSFKRMYINLPRAEVESIPGYYTNGSQKWMFSGSSSPKYEIICNDDEGFMTKEEFDSIDWENYFTE